MLLTLTLKIANPDDLPHADPERPREFLSTTMSMRRMAPSTDEAVREGTLVLVVDDHPTNRQLIALQVRTLGYAADTADNGAAALAAWNTGRYSMIFTDCNMPEMDGYALARSIRSIEAGRGAVRVPIVAFTATALSGHRETCISAGMDDCLVKPVNLSQILRSLDKWLPIPRQSSAAPAPAPSPALADAAREQSPIDRLALAEISHGNTTTEHEILVDFRLANDGDAAVLLKAVAAGDTADVAHLAHRILGACRMVGAHALAGVCTRLSEASRTRDAATLATDMTDFQIEWGRVNAYVDAL
jgi:CheY-like chemotaxis protein/HPt (histidine-containing phosphotransfer) domain-containing protein